MDAIPFLVFPGRHFSTLLSVLSHICTPFAAAVGEKQVHIKRSFNLTFLFFFRNCDPRAFRILCDRFLNTIILPFCSWRSHFKFIVKLQSVLTL